jgi:hypothetical protein
MPPKKRGAEGDAAGSEQTSELRRSTRGGGHAAAEPKAKPASSKSATKPASASKAKKAKTDDKSEDAVAPEEKNGAKEDTKADAIVAEAEKDAKKEGVDVPEENKEAAQAKAGKRIEVGETLPEGIILKVGPATLSRSVCL